MWRRGRGKFLEALLLEANSLDGGHRLRNLVKFGTHQGCRKVQNTSRNSSPKRYEHEKYLAASGARRKFFGNFTINSHILVKNEVF